MTGNRTEYLKETALRELAEKSAFQLLFEWRSSENFRAKERWRALWRGTSSFADEQRLEAEHGNLWVLQKEGKQLLEFRRRVTLVWVERGWVSVLSVHTGRPRGEGPAEPTLAKARKRAANAPSWSTKPEWVSRLLWESPQKTTEWLVVDDTNLLSEVARELPVEELEGTTREELAEALDCSTKLAKALVRHLVESGDWKVVHNGKVGRRELRRVVK